MQAVLDTIAQNGPAVIVLAAIVGAGIFVVVTGSHRGKRQVAAVVGDSAPASIKAAIDNLAATNERLEAAKREEIAAVKDMASIIAASNRIAGDAGKGNEEMVRLFQRNLENFATTNSLLTQIVQEQRLASERLLALQRK